MDSAIRDALLILLNICLALLLAYKDNVIAVFRNGAKKKTHQTDMEIERDRLHLEAYTRNEEMLDSANADLKKLHDKVVELQADLIAAQNVMNENKTLLAESQLKYQSLQETLNRANELINRLQARIRTLTIELQNKENAELVLVNELRSKNEMIKIRDEHIARQRIEYEKLQEEKGLLSKALVNAETRIRLLLERLDIVDDVSLSLDPAAE